jgi:hypothetical protein
MRKPACRQAGVEMKEAFDLFGKLKRRYVN